MMGLNERVNHSDRIISGVADFAPAQAALSVSLVGRAASTGQTFLACLAANFRCAMREAGMPILRQLWTVEVGAWISFATALVPPKPSMMRSASVFMYQCMR